MLEKFIRSVLPDSGFIRIIRMHIPKQRKAKYMWAPSLDEAITDMQNMAGETRLYFGTASYKTAETGESSNVLLNKALRLDIDAGEEKYAKHGDEVYATREDALADLHRFAEDTGLDPSYLVSSGEGWHVYYALAEALDPDAWHHMANRLFDLCQAVGLRVDHTTTTDVTRLLRVPGGQHDNGRTVELIADTSGHEYTTEELDALLPHRPRFSADDLSMNEAFAENDERRYPPSSVKKILTALPELLPVMEARGRVPEPLWRAMLGLLKHTVEGERLAHAWSRGYEGYDEEETQRKLDGWKVGPPSMEELSKYVPALHDSEHWGKVTSPIQLGVMTDTEQESLPEAERSTAPTPKPAPTGHPWDNHLPEDTRVVPFGRTGKQLQYAVKQTSKDADGGITTSKVWVPVTNTVFWFVRWGEALGEESARALLRAWSSGRVVQYEVDQSVLAAPAELIKFLASRAIHVTTHSLAVKAVFQYAKSQFQEIQKMKHDLTVNDRFGLRIVDGDKLVAVQGRFAIFGDGSIHDTILGKQLRDQSEAYTIPVANEHNFQESWEPSVWKRDVMPRAKEYVEFLAKHFGVEGVECYQLAIMAAIASPLMAFVTGEFRGERLPGMCTLNLSLYSRQSGYGKTAACQAGAIAYGLPSMLVSGQGNSAATEFYRFKRLAVSGTMPNVMDEMGSLSARQTYTLLSTAANGADKGLGRRDGTMRSTSPWALVNLLTTNRSLQELLRAPGADKTDAVQRRILEIDVGGVPTHDAEARAQYALDYGKVAAECAGALGAVMHLLIVRRGLDGMHQLVLTAVNKAAEMLGAGQNDRFLYRGLGAILAAGQLLDSVGLLPFDLRTVAMEYKSCYIKSSNVIEETRTTFEPMYLLNRALLALLPSTLITETDGRGRSVVVPLNERMPQEVHARHIKSEGVTYVSADALARWASEERLSLEEIMSAAEVHHILLRQTGDNPRRVVRKNLSSGITGNTGQRDYAYKIDIRALEDWLNEMTAPETQDDEESPDNVIEMPQRDQQSAAASTPRSDSTAADA